MQSSAQVSALRGQRWILKRAQGGVHRGGGQQRWRVGNRVGAGTGHMV